MPDIRAIGAKYAAYPNIVKFFEIQAEFGNDELLRKFEPLEPHELAKLFEMSLEQIDEMAAQQIKAMERGRC